MFLTNCNQIWYFPTDVLIFPSIKSHRSPSSGKCANTWEEGIDRHTEGQVEGHEEGYRRFSQLCDKA